MNILFICDEYPPGKNGGVGTVVQVLARELVRQGHKVFVAGLYAHSYGQKDYEEDQGVKVWRFRYGINLHLPHGHILHKAFNRIPQSIKQHLNGQKAFHVFTEFIHSLIDNQQIDIIEAPDWNTFAMRIGFTVKWPTFKVPMVVKLHGSYTYLAHEMHTPAKPWLTAIDRALYERADALCAVSAYTADKCKALFQIKKNIRVLYNGIETMPDLPIKKENTTVIFTGTLISLKGIFQLIKAWNLVNKQLPQAKLLIFGKGTTEPLRKLVHAGASNTVHFKGHIPRQELFKQLASATVAVFPSYTETFGMGPVEAMGAGCPVIFTKRASGPEIISDKVNGELIDPDNIEEISASIIRIISRPDLQKQYSEKGKETVREKFSISTSAHNHIDYYTEVIRHYTNTPTITK